MDGQHYTRKPRSLWSSIFSHLGEEASVYLATRFAVDAEQRILVPIQDIGRGMATKLAPLAM